ncbi:transglycosylase domain-containing protein [Paenactinomyces guangxiensis]|uniref:PBP1A family penicillin-binding protein n=1 Tax=Paenactinomyces guangxiensis TaxID=1490290 RepID=A0A7W1WQH1_9BACL|nr:PBP1A family penicillin-binding protein [Paenactinomyces guangxiensis]MBA4494068.1 PBP1A family penicillin-binding protein [Paenactinomyces guangxiensis]MBH8591187.1 PBP1A family penicillin-binding protein [Paenactinomyces guangxiensis]
MGEQKTTPDHPPLNQFPVWRLIKWTYRIFCWMFIITLICSAALGVAILYLKSKPLPPPEISSSSKLYDAKGRYIGQIDEGEYREPVKLEQVPQSLIQATLAAEDKNFYHHWGFSLTGIIRAVIANLKAGHVVQGASTITQQLARNLYLTHDRTWSRKIKEAILTVQLELHYTKDEILEMYLNEIYYGHGAYGVGRAARVYFNKNVEQLNLAESAFLAGIPRGPQYYSPYFHLPRARQRQRYILDLMVRNQMITAQEAQQAKQTTLAIAEPSKPQQIRASYFRDYVIQTAVLQYGLEESVVRRGGLKIYTTLDPRMQKYAEESVKQFLGDKKDLQGALISADPHTGHIKAMVGGKDYSKSQYNRVFARRQPGSSFKPVLYLSALENGFTPLTQIISRPTAFAYEGGIYRPSNYRGQYANRPITLREAIARSDNIYAVSTLFHIGINKEIDMARKLGIKSPLRPTPSLALGSYPITPYELAQAYATIADGGIRHPLTGIRKIVDSYGKVLVENETNPIRVTSPAHSYVLTRLLTSVFDSGGTGHRVRQMFLRAAAGKTGTTDWDGWLSGFTPDLVTTVWVGYDHSRKLPHHEARLSQYIWGSYMKKATALQPARIFPVPQGVKGVYIDIETGYLATPFCKHTRLEFFVRGTEPRQTCPEHPGPVKRSGNDPSLWERFIDWWNSF